MAENSSVENDVDKPRQDIELTDKEQAQKTTDEKDKTSASPKETKNKSMGLKYDVLWP